MAGYSGTPLYKKLGLKEGISARLINAPENFKELIKEVSASISFRPSGPNLDYIHLFTNSMKELETRLPELKSELKKDGLLWVSWYKKAAKKQTELNENIIRDLALQAGLVDVKVCAVDEDWAGLKLVFRLVDR